jgi:WD40 repeat protein
VWDIDGGTRRFETEQPGRDIGEFALDERGETLLVIASSRATYRASDRSALMYRLADGTCWELPSTATIRAAAWVPGTDMALTGDDAGRLTLWSASTGEELATAAGPGRSITCRAVTPDGTRVVVGGEDLELGGWSVPELRPIWARKSTGDWMPTTSIATIAILAPGDRAFVATRTHVSCETLRIDDGAELCLRDDGDGNESTTRAVSSPDGSLLANWGTGMDCDAVRDSVDLRKLLRLGRRLSRPVFRLKSVEANGGMSRVATAWTEAV